LTKASPTAEHPDCIAKVENLDISKLNKEKAYSGTDYGFQTMAVTVPITQDKFKVPVELFNHFNILDSLQVFDPFLLFLASLITILLLEMVKVLST
jgi:hypothetical protein